MEGGRERARGERERERERELKGTGALSDELVDVHS